MAFNEAKGHELFILGAKKEMSAAKRYCSRLRP